MGNPFASLSPSAVGPRHAGQFPWAGAEDMQIMPARIKAPARILLLLHILDKDFPFLFIAFTGMMRHE
jgi:hypothetical protein